MIPLIRMDSFPFFEDLALIYIPKIEVEFGFHSLSDEIAYVLYLRNSRISVATFSHFSIMQSGKDLMIFRRLLFMFTSAKELI